VVSVQHYDEDGSNRKENITDWALKEFRTHYKDKKIDKWSIFYYVYGCYTTRIPGEIRDNSSGNCRDSVYAAVPPVSHRRWTWCGKDRR